MAEIIDQRTDQPIQYSGGIIITRPAITDTTLHSFNGQKLTNRQILSKINESGGGLAFADGGEMPDSIHTTGRVYEIGGMQKSDTEIVHSCGCKHSAAKGIEMNEKISFEDFVEKVPMLYGKTGNWYIPYPVGQGFITYTSSEQQASQAIKDIYNQINNEEIVAGDFNHYADLFDVSKAYDLIDKGEIAAEEIEIDTVSCEPTPFSRFNKDYAENLEGIDFTKVQGLVVDIPYNSGMPDGQTLIDGRHRSHYGASTGIDKMKVYKISDPRQIEKIKRDGKHYASGGTLVSGAMSYREFLSGYGRKIYLDNINDKIEYTVVLPVSYGQRIFTSDKLNFKEATKEIYQDYLKEKDRYQGGGSMGKTYRYALTIRPFGIGTYPTKGFVRYEDSPVYKFGILLYSEPLGLDEISHFDLIPLDLLEELNGKKIKWFENYEGTINLMTDPVGRITGVRVDVDFNGEIVEEKLSCVRFIKNYQSNKYGQAYQKGGEIKAKYRHRHIPELTLEIIEPTAKGYKVKQFEQKGNKVKEKITFYNDIDFHSEKGLWVKENQNND